MKKKNNDWNRLSYVKKGAIIGFLFAFGLSFLLSYFPFIIWAILTKDISTRVLFTFSLTLASLVGIIGAAVGSLIGFIIQKVKNA